MNVLRSALLVCVGCLASSLALAADLDGFWKNDAQPAWIEIRPQSESAAGTVRRNDNNPDAVGRVLLKNIVRDPDTAGAWRGQIYAARLGEYRDAEVTLVDPEHMQIKVSVGFMSRTVSWTRVAEVPEG